MQAPSTAPAYAHININEQIATASRSRTIGLCILLSFLFFICNSTVVTAQSCIRQVRVYANMQQFYGSGLLGLLPGTIQNAGYAVDGLPDTRSTLQVDLGLLNASHAIRYLQFTGNG